MTIVFLLGTLQNGFQKQFAVTETDKQNSSRKQAATRTVTETVIADI